MAGKPPEEAAAGLRSCRIASEDVGMPLEPSRVAAAAAAAEAAAALLESLLSRIEPELLRGRDKDDSRVEAKLVDLTWPRGPAL
jgi:hypothetical protein